MQVSFADNDLEDVKVFGGSLQTSLVRVVGFINASMDENIRAQLLAELSNTIRPHLNGGEGEVILMEYQPTVNTSQKCARVINQFVEPHTLCSNAKPVGEMNKQVALWTI